MAVTRLERKDRKNKARSNNRKARIKFYNRKPVLKQVDVEAIKKEFEEKKQAQKDSE